MQAENFDLKGVIHSLFGGGEFDDIFGDVSMYVSKYVCMCVCVCSMYV